MKHNPRLFALLLSLPLLYLYGCERSPDNCSFLFTNNWTIGHLDNSGASPELSAQDISRSAYGFRISNIGSGASEEGCRYDGVVENLEIFTLRPFNGYAAGSDVTQLFAMRSQVPPHNYFVADLAVGELFAPHPKGDTIPVDLLLLYGPEQPDTCQFGVQFLLTRTTENDPFGIDTIITGYYRVDSIWVNLKTTPVYLK